MSSSTIVQSDAVTFVARVRTDAGSSALSATTMSARTAIMLSAGKIGIDRMKYKYLALLEFPLAQRVGPRVG